MVDPRLEEDDEKKILRIAYITCPVSAVVRAVKYGRKGFRLPVVEVFRILRAWSELEVEEDVLVEIDTALRAGASWGADEWRKWYGSEAVRRVARFD